MFGRLKGRASPLIEETLRMFKHSVQGLRQKARLSKGQTSAQRLRWITAREPLRW
jgi:hypothetical protein